MMRIWAVPIGQEARHHYFDFNFFLENSPIPRKRILIFDKVAGEIKKKFYFQSESFFILYNIIHKLFLSEKKSFAVPTLE